MKKYIANIFVFLFVFGLLSLSSCYTKKKGIVPCPHGYNETTIENITIIPSEKV